MSKKSINGALKWVIAGAMVSTSILPMSSFGADLPAKGDACKPVVTCDNARKASLDANLKIKPEKAAETMQKGAGESEASLQTMAQKNCAAQKICETAF